MDKGSLERLIFQHYARSALLPILTIEIFLLVLYFSINAWTNYQTERTLQGEVTSVLPGIANRQAQSISNDFAGISRQTAYFAAAHVGPVSQPANYPVQGEQPAFAFAPNGTWYQTNLAEGSSLFYSKIPRISEHMKEVAAHTACLNDLYRHVVRDNPDVAAAYYNTADGMNRLYPYIPKVYEQYPATLDMATYNFFYLGDAKHDPARVPVWTGVYLDPAGNGWMLSCVAPVYVADTVAGVVGLDVTINTIVKHVLAMQLPWKASAFLADDKGMILAMSPEVEELFGLKELKDHVYDSAISTERLKPEDYNLFNNADTGVSKAFRRIYDASDVARSVTIKGRQLFIIQDKISETGWRLFVVAQSDEVYRAIHAVTRLSHRIGYVVILGMLLFYIAFFLFLRRRARTMAVEIIRPIRTLAEATSRIGTAQQSGAIAQSGIEEIDALTKNFNTMVTELDERSQELIAGKVAASIQEKEAALAYERGRFESASGYLHNVGNSITRLNSSLMDLGDIVKSTDQYPAVFEKLRAGDDPEILARFEQVLVGKTVPRLQSCMASISAIGDLIHQTILHHQESFSHSKDVLKPASFDLSRVVVQACTEFGPAAGEKVELEMNIEPDIFVLSHRHQMYHGVVNVVKNAVEATRPQGRIEVSLARIEGGARLIVSDSGSGIDAAHLAKVMTAGFSTKEQGHGLGLHSFAVFLSAAGGRMHVASEGEGRGTTVTVEVRDV